MSINKFLKTNFELSNKNISLILNKMEYKFGIKNNY